jgi:TolA-binding protein
MIEQSHVPGTTPRPRSMPHQWSFAQQREQQIQTLQSELDEAKKRIVELTKALDAMNERQRQEWARAENAEAQSDAFLEWSQLAYEHLDCALDTVSAEAEIGIRALMAAAPEAVKGGER